MNEKELKRFLSNMLEHVNELCENDNMTVGTFEDHPFIIVEDWNTVYKLYTYLAIEGGVYDLFQSALDHPKNEWDKHGSAMLTIIPGPAPVLFEDIYINNKKSFRLIDDTRDISYKNDEEFERYCNFQDMLEKFWEVFGEFGFSDEYTTCSNCGDIIKTSPDSYDWQPDYIITEDGEIFCKDCMDVDDILDSHKNREKALPENILDQAVNQGLVVELDKTYENGLHSGMNDDPKIILKRFKQAKIDIWFHIHPSQFYVEFNVVVRPEDKEAAEMILDKLNTYQGYDNATELDKALRGQHSDYYHVETKTISPEDFIAGKI